MLHLPRTAAGLLLALPILGCGKSENGMPPPGPAGTMGGPDANYDSTMNFFATSRGGPKGGDFRLNESDPDGLAGADAFCKELAMGVSPDLGGKTWRAYL